MGGHRLEDERQVLNQAASWKALLSGVEHRQFELSHATFCDLHGLVAREEALEWGVFRTGSVTIAGTDFEPPPWQSLGSIFEAGLETLHRIDDLHERAIAMFLFGALNQFFYDGNKRTSRLMMNGILLSAGEGCDLGARGPTAGVQRGDDSLLRQPGRDGDDAFHGRLFAGPRSCGRTLEHKSQMTRRASKTSTKPRLLSGGNPQIAKGDGDAPVQAYIAAMPEWKHDLGRGLDALIEGAVPGVQKCVRWNSPFYGVDGQGWFASYHVFTRYVKVTFFRGSSLQPLPPGVSKGKDRDSRWGRHPRG